ncbi:MAG TPA: hypothetical protein VK932_09185 [Kofleriaceae bacterium]|nr:hypothetical protein [Kofleriaceae bacterium]
MRITSYLSLLIVGMFMGGVSVLSCDSGSPGNVDAATCDCPAAEPPLAERIMVVNQTQTIPANSRGGQGAACPQGALRLEGSCTTAELNPLRDVTLEQSGIYQPNDLRGWNCFFKNNEATPVTIKVSIVCLLPPGS